MPSTQPESVAIRGSFLHCLDDPAVNGDSAIQFLDDGLLCIDDGHVTSLEPARQRPLAPHYQYIDMSGQLIVPGFVDTHVHYPQVDVLASYGSQLLDWLNQYTFPIESEFSDLAVATDTANFFLDELLRNGTTTALVFGTVHPQSVQAFFTSAANRNLRMICGKVMMDRHAPDNLCDTAESSYADSKALIAQWHGRDRLGYAVTPRFAPTSSTTQLAAAGRLLDEHPGVHLHTHLAENRDECDWAAKLFPHSHDYLNIYEQHGLVRKRAVFAHCVHLDDSSWQRLAAADAAVAHCPMSNLFIGSGLFSLKDALRAKVTVGLGTDIGGGDSFSLLRCLNEAYKVQQLQGFSLTPEHGLYLATLGGAKALDLDSVIGNFLPGKEADFIVLNEHATPLLQRRSKINRNWRDRLFMLMILGDDRCIADTYILGKSVKQQVATAATVSDSG